MDNISHEYTDEVSIDNANTKFDFIEILEEPTDILHATNKKYVDRLVENIKWEKAVSNFHDPHISLPKNPEIGERFVSSGTGRNWIINRIYEYTGGDEVPWLETIPEKGYIIWVQHQNEATFIFNGITWDRIGKTIIHDDLKNIGVYSHQKIDEHINNKSMHIREAQLSHLKIKDTGTFTHSAIDYHIQNNRNAHFGQNLSKNGTPEFKSVRVSDVSMASHIATKDYVDSKILGLKWGKPVNSFFDPSNGIPEQCLGNRYVCMETIKGWKKNYIYEFDNSEWKEIMPTKDCAIYVESGNIFNGCTVLYNGNDWIKFGTTENHSNLSNTGIHTHTEIDNHINNNNDAHFGQDLTDHGTPTFANLYVSNKTTMKLSTVGEQIISGKLQIGDYKLPHTMDSNFTMISNNEKANVTFLYADASSDEPINLIHMRARGDVYAPKELLDNTSIGSLVYMGYDGNTYCETSSIKCVTTENYSSDAHGSAIQFNTTQNNSTTPSTRMKIDNDGTLFNYCTNNSTSIDTGSLIAYGGVGIRQNLNIGGTLNIKNKLLIQSTDNSVVCNNTDDNSLILCGGRAMETGSCIKIHGNNNSSNGSIQLNTSCPNSAVDISVNEKNKFSITETQCVVNNKTLSTSVTTGGLVVIGGMGIGDNLNIGGSIVTIGSSGVSNTAVIKLNTTENNDNGCLNICGGGDNNAGRGSVIKLAGNNYGDDSGSIILSTGQSVCGKIRFFTNTMHERGHILNDGTWHILTTTDADTLDTGALVVDGGVSINKKLIVRNLQCLTSAQLPLSEEEPDGGEIGAVYYDTLRDCIRVYSKHGWRNIAYK